MTIDVTQILKNYADEDLTNDGQPLALRGIFTAALNNGSEILTAEKKAKIYQLSLKIYAQKEVAFTPDDIDFIKERVGIVWSAIVYGRVCDLFDQKN